jgi:hypothetical protein
MFISVTVCVRAFIFVTVCVGAFMSVTIAVRAFAVTVAVRVLIAITIGVRAFIPVSVHRTVVGIVLPLVSIWPIIPVPFKPLPLELAQTRLVSPAFFKPLSLEPAGDPAAKSLPLALAEKRLPLEPAEDTVAEVLPLGPAEQRLAAAEKRLPALDPAGHPAVKPFPLGRGEKRLPLKPADEPMVKPLPLAPAQPRLVAVALVSAVFVSAVFEFTALDIAVIIPVAWSKLALLHSVGVMSEAMGRRVGLAALVKAHMAVMGRRTQRRAAHRDGRCRQTNRYFTHHDAAHSNTPSEHPSLCQANSAISIELQRCGIVDL